MKNLQELVTAYNGENVLGTIIEHPKYGRAVLTEVQPMVTVYYERQDEGHTGFRNLLYDLQEWIIVTPFDWQKADKAMEVFLK